MQSPQTFSRGKTARSRRRTRSPASAHPIAQAEPPGPPPTIATSYRTLLHEGLRHGIRHELAATREHIAIFVRR